MSAVRKVYVGLHVPEDDVKIVSWDIKKLILDSEANNLSKETVDLLFAVHQGISSR